MSASPVSRAARALSALAAALLVPIALGACGYKGPLTMPAPAAPDETLTAPPQAADLPIDNDATPTPLP